MLRGRVYRALPVDFDTAHYFVVVSNNARNRALPSVLAVRLTTANKPPLPSIVELPPGEVLTGRAACDDIYELWDDEVHQDLGAFSPTTLAAIDDGLRAALSL
ncbi:MAG TPA: type II toxin-antitoxin system PemK/MazF family toxin [Actinomycetota bacterium]|nr:type II toxin-antitoxin system PemK/MazF family toxin [Actinomycetota bacterium]HNL52004.1 type II toxin-antitoxin system PemK/MazF family toxin [Actinomycetota bacterium]HNM95852.1 type II toxin-antitoxin system PemK/MazF family toxin [Mycobacterium sp.]